MSDILIHTEAGVQTITFNRVEKKNSITRAMYRELSDALDAASEDAAVRVVLLQGDITIFSAGNDIGDFLSGPPADDDAPAFRFLRTIAGFAKPLLAAVCGPAVGIGTAMAQAQARKLAAKPLSSLIETKRLLKKGQAALVIRQMQEEGAGFGRMLREPAAKEAFTAFMQKRKPDFSAV
jgi:enoyl-CoA hydratase/carnithine racemase